MKRIHDLLGLYLFTFVYELIRRQLPRCGILVLNTSQEPHMLSEHSVQRDPGLSFRWIVVADEDGKRRLRMLCRQR
jgi:hypothetical protein